MCNGKSVQKLVSMALVFLITVAVIQGFTAPVDAANIEVNVDGQLIAFPDQQPYADENCRILVPIRFPMEAMGVTVQWNPDNQQAVLTGIGKIVIFTIGSTTYTIDGIAHTMDTVPVAVGGRTVFPIRFAAEAFGASVSWDGPANTVIITTGEEAIGEVPEVIIKEYPKDASELREAVLLQISGGDGVKVKCTNIDDVNMIALINPYSNELSGIIGRFDEDYSAYWTLAATKVYGSAKDYQVQPGQMLYFDVWIQVFNQETADLKEYQVLDEYKYIVPDSPWN